MVQAPPLTRRTPVNSALVRKNTCDGSLTGAVARILEGLCAESVGGSILRFHFHCVLQGFFFAFRAVAAALRSNCAQTMGGLHFSFSIS